jgi:hypothetical protein
MKFKKYVQNSYFYSQGVEPKLFSKERLCYIRLATILELSTRKYESVRWKIGVKYDIVSPES